MPNKNYKYSGIYKYNNELIGLLKKKEKLKFCIVEKLIVFLIFYGQNFL